MIKLVNDNTNHSILITPEELYEKTTVGNLNELSSRYNTRILFLSWIPCIKEIHFKYFDFDKGDYQDKKQYLSVLLQSGIKPIILEHSFIEWILRNVVEENY